MILFYISIRLKSSNYILKFCFMSFESYHSVQKVPTLNCTFFVFLTHCVLLMDICSFTNFKKNYTCLYVWLTDFTKKVAERIGMISNIVIRMVKFYCFKKIYISELIKSSLFFNLFNDFFFERSIQFIDYCVHFRNQWFSHFDLVIYRNLMAGRSYLVMPLSTWYPDLKWTQNIKNGIWRFLFHKIWNRKHET